MFHAPNSRERTTAFRGLLVVLGLFLVAGDGFAQSVSGIEASAASDSPAAPTSGPAVGDAGAGFAAERSALSGTTQPLEGRTIYYDVSKLGGAATSSQVPGSVVGGKWSLLQGAPDTGTEMAPMPNSMPQQMPSIDNEPLGGSIPFRQMFDEIWGKHSGWFVSADFLYWKPRQPNLTITVLETIVVPNSTQVQPVTLSRVGLDWNAGFRTAVGYRAFDNFDAQVIFTHYHTGGNSLAVGTLNPSPLGVPTPLVTTGDSNLDFNVIDFAIGQWFQPTKRIDFHFYGGPRLAYIDSGINAYNTSAALGGTVAELVPSRFSGYGLMFGGEAYWNLGKNFQLYTRANGSMLVGDYRTSLTVLNVNGAQLIGSQDSFSRMAPVMEMAIGLSWCCGPLQLMAGYELANWFNVIDRGNLTTTGALGAFGPTTDLGLDGLFVRGGLRF